MGPLGSAQIYYQPGIKSQQPPQARFLETPQLMEPAAARFWAPKSDTLDPFSNNL